MKKIEAKTGWVYLVGAGIGDPELITMKGLFLIQSADCIVYDRLVAPELIAEASADAVQINVGKGPNKVRFSQDEINRIIVEQAELGRSVVRLKGGDPFVYGLGGDEGLYLRQYNIPFEVVPGISSSLAASGYAGIPITHRGIATSVAVLSGHDLSSDEWHSLPRTGTIVVLMGAKKRSLIAELLLKNGREPDTPVACIHSASTPKQKVVYTTIGELATFDLRLPPPTIFVIGQVVALADQLQWFVPDASAEFEWGDERNPNSTE